jgi:hypothetical protein
MKVEHADQLLRAEDSRRHEGQRWYTRWLADKPSPKELAPHEYGCKICGSA